jgi:hypothetical protein
MPFFAKRNARTDGEGWPELSPAEMPDPPAPAPESGMSPMLAKVLGMLGFDPAQLQEMSEKTALVVKDAQERLTRIEAKLDEILVERRAVHTALSAQKNGEDRDTRA